MQGMYGMQGHGVDQTGGQPVRRVSVGLIIAVALVSLVVAAGATFVAMRYIKTR